MDTSWKLAAALLALVVLLPACVQGQGSSGSTAVLQLVQGPTDRPGTCRFDSPEIYRMFTGPWTSLDLYRTTNHAAAWVRWPLACFAAMEVTLSGKGAALASLVAEPYHMPAIEAEYPAKCSWADIKQCQSSFKCQAVNTTARVAQGGNQLQGISVPPQAAYTNVEEFANATHSWVLEPVPGQAGLLRMRIPKLCNSPTELELTFQVVEGSLFGVKPATCTGGPLCLAEKRCPAGMYLSKATDGRAICVRCLPGSVSSGGVNAVCTKCPKATFNPVYGAINCAICPPGTYALYPPGAPQTGLYSCAFCGDTEDILENTTLPLCPYHNSNERNWGDYNEPADWGRCHYSSRPGASKCELCPDHSTALLGNFTSCVACAYGDTCCVKGSAGCAKQCPALDPKNKGVSATMVLTGYRERTANAECKIIRAAKFVDTQLQLPFNCTHGFTDLPFRGPVNYYNGNAVQTVLKQPLLLKTARPRFGYTQHWMYGDGFFYEDVWANVTVRDGGAGLKLDFHDCSLDWAVVNITGGAGDAIGLKEGPKCPPGNPKCVACPAGSYQVPGTNTCALCHPGTFSGAPGATECTACPRGTFATGVGNSRCTPCGPSNYDLSDGPSADNGFAGSQSCARCFGVRESPTKCSDCPDGTAGNSKTCLQCSKGQACCKPGSLGCPAGSPLACKPGFKPSTAVAEISAVAKPPPGCFPLWVDQAGQDTDRLSLEVDGSCRISTPGDDMSTGSNVLPYGQMSGATTASLSFGCNGCDQLGEIERRITVVDVGRKLLEVQLWNTSYAHQPNYKKLCSRQAKLTRGTMFGITA